ncbi:restriction endonuclease subunit S [Paenarthrobacter sp. FR1]|uniref:restriction endonuclease subunit S n=1 Tax=Paenarthrobacter sp. FR1 TaxID=3439548 RepID=UPI003DA23AB0
MSSSAQTLLRSDLSQTALLGEHVEILSGFAFDASLFSDTDGIPLIRIRDVVRGYTETRYRGAYEEKYLVQPGDLLVGMDGDFNRALWTSEPALLNQRVCRVTAQAQTLDQRYLYHFLPYPLMDIWHQTPFATVKHLSAKSIKSIRIPLPPIAEQQRIAAILDKADELRAKRRQAIAHLDALTHSIFHSMFGSPSPTSAELAIEDLAASPKGAIRTGPFGSQLLTSEFTDDGVAVLGIDNAVTNTFAWAQRRYISEEKYDQLRRYRVWPGDLLITIMGTLGRCAVVPRDVPKAINTKHLCCITLNRDLVVPEWLHAYFLQSETARSYLRQTTKGAIMGGLNMGIIKNMPVSVPPLALQQTFANRVAAVERLNETHRKHLAELDALFASLQSRAFKGEL